MYNATENPIIKMDRMSIHFDELKAVDQISLTVQPGEIRGLLGGNGAGKSSTLKVLGGVMKPTSGVVTVDGYDMTTFTGTGQARSILGYCPDVGGLVSGASPVEHVKLLASLHKKNKGLYERGLEGITRFNLHEFKDNPTSGFSHGQSRRLSVLLSSLTAEKVLILDEPYDGVDPLGVEIINETIAEAAQRGAAVVISTHLQNLLTEVSDTVTVMNKGLIKATLPAEELRGEEGIKAYREFLTGERNE